jgi:tRNA (adenine37-N6)-methyltransferase
MERFPDAGWQVEAIGVVHNDRTEAIDDDWGAIESVITLLAPFDADSVSGLSEFSHVDVVFLFDRVDPADITAGARVPRGNPDWPEVGIFAQRAKMRPNRIGVCTCSLVTVDVSGDAPVLRVRGLDAIDGSPVLDVKPYMAEFGPRGRVDEPAWVHELMQGYF